MTGSYGLGGSLMNITFLVLFLSLNLGLVNCAAHAYGARNLELVGLYYHRALVIHTIVCIPCAVCFYFSDKICLMIDFDPVVASHIHELLSHCIPGMFAQMFFTTTVAYLNACGVFTVPGLIPPIACLIYFLTSYFFIQKLGLGIVGAAISYDIQAFLLAISIVIYVKFWDPVPNTMFAPRKESFKGLWRLFKFELLTGSMVYLEWIAFEIIAVFSGLLENKSQFTSVSVFFAHAMLVGAIPLGLREVILTFASQALGEKNVKKTKMILKAGMVIISLATVLIILYLLFFSRYVVTFYVEDPETVETATQYFLLLAFLAPSDYAQCVLGSGLRALRKDTEGTVLMIIGYYVVSIPLAYCLGFVAKLGGMGLLFGVIGGSYSLLIGLSAVLYRVDWDKQVRVIIEQTTAEGSIPEIDTDTESTGAEKLKKC